MSPVGCASARRDARQATRSMSDRLGGSNGLDRLDGCSGLDRCSGLDASSRPDTPSTPDASSKPHMSSKHDTPSKPHTSSKLDMPSKHDASSRPDGPTRRLVRSTQQIQRTQRTDTTDHRATLARQTGRARSTSDRPAAQVGGAGRGCRRRRTIGLEAASASRAEGRPDAELPEPADRAGVHHGCVTAPQAASQPRRSRRLRRAGCGGGRRRWLIEDRRPETSG